MGSVSVYRLGAVCADPSYFFAGEARDSDLRHAASLGWLLLTLVELAGPGVALADDTRVTAPAGCSESSRPADSGDVVPVLEAAVALIARPPTGLPAFPTGSADVVSDRLIWALSLTVLVADDLAAHADGFRTAHLVVAEGLDGVEQERAVLDACPRSPGHAHGRVPHVLYCPATAAADPVMRRRGVVLQGLCPLDVFPASAVARFVPVSGSSVRVPMPIVIAIPRDLQSSCARSMFGLCPLSSDRIAFSGRPASRAARLVPQPRCFSCACTSSASWWLAGPVGFLFIRVFTLSIRVFTPVLHVAVFGWDTDPRIALVPRSSRAAVELLGSRRRCLLLRRSGPTRRWRPFALLVAGLVYVRVLRAFSRPVDSSCSAVRAFDTLFGTGQKATRPRECFPWGFDARPCWIRGGAA